MIKEKIYLKRERSIYNHARLRTKRANAFCTLDFNILY